jgi:hypothetical protein
MKKHASRLHARVVLFLTFICSALFLGQKIIAEVEKGLAYRATPIRDLDERTSPGVRCLDHTLLAFQTAGALAELRAMGSGCFENSSERYRLLHEHSYFSRDHCRPGLLEKQ